MESPYVWQLVFDYASGTDVSVLVVGGVAVVHLDARAGGVYELELAGGRVDVGDDAHVAYGAGGAGAAEKHEVAFLERRGVVDGCALAVLCARRAAEVDALAAVDVAGEAGAVECRGTGMTTAIAGTEILESGAHDVVTLRGGLCLLVFISLGRSHLQRCHGCFGHQALCRCVHRHSVALERLGV